MLEHFGLDDEAALRKAIHATTGAAILTSDAGGTATPDDVTATIIDQLEPAPAGYADGDP
jgi:isocitrate/isopropylmalate dehydrogenase